jgi:hypothetical protein
VTWRETDSGQITIKTRARDSRALVYWAWRSPASIAMSTLFAGVANGQTQRGS